MQIFPPDKAPTHRRFGRLGLYAAALLAITCALPAGADQALRNEWLIGLINTTPPSEKITGWVADCPGPLDTVHAPPACDDDSPVHARTDNLLPRRRGSDVALPALKPVPGNPLTGRGKPGSRLSKVRITWQKASAGYTFGLLDSSSFIDTIAAEDDHSAQFYAPLLSSNPTIQFPDDALGGGFFWQGKANLPNVYLALTSSHGMGDNPTASYGELISVTDEGKGIFASAELEWRGRTTYHLGAWTNTASNPRLSKFGTKANYGLYGTAYGNHNRTRWRVRAGLANRQVSAAAWFLSAAVNQDLGLVTAGMGTAVTGASSELGSGTTNTWVSELYLIHDFNGSVYISPHLQYQRNPGFDATGNAVSRGEWIASVKSNVVF